MATQLDHPIDPNAGALIVLGGETLVLMPDRAVWWPARATVLVADVHLGKGAVFRRAGLAVPSGGSADDIQRLDRLVRVTAARRVVVLGDLLHGRSQPDEPAVRALADWRQRRPELSVIAVRGNHDRHAAHTLDAWVDWVDDPAVHAPLVLRHDPLPHPHGPVLAGHTHPVVRGPDGLRVAVFWHQPGVLVLPSFGRFTGGHRITPGPNDAVWAAGDTAVLPLSGAPSSLESSPCPSPCTS